MLSLMGEVGCERGVVWRSVYLQGRSLRGINKGTAWVSVGTNICISGKKRE